MSKKSILILSFILSEELLVLARARGYLFSPVAPLCMLATGWGFPGVILNFATAYLRMMVPNPVAAKERGMKQ